MKPILIIICNQPMNEATREETERIQQYLSPDYYALFIYDPEQKETFTFKITR